MEFCAFLRNSHNESAIFNQFFQPIFAQFWKIFSTFRDHNLLNNFVEFAEIHAILDEQNFGKDIFLNQKNNFYL